jgi:hypothetical protein
MEGDQTMKYTVDYEEEGNDRAANYKFTVIAEDAILCFCSTKKDANLIAKALNQYEEGKKS